MTLEQLFEGSDLSQDFKTKVQSMIDEAINEEKAKQESLVEARVAEKAQEIQETYAQYGEEYGEYVKEQMEDKMEDYLNEEVVPTLSKYVDAVADSYMKENKLQIESGLKVELAEKFFASIMEAAQGFNVDIPENTSMVESLEEKLARANEKVDSLLGEKEELSEEVSDMKKMGIFDKVADKADLTESQKDRFQVACENVKFVDESQYTSTLEELVESYGANHKGVDTVVEDKKDDFKGTLNENQPTADWFSKVFDRV